MFPDTNSMASAKVLSPFVGSTGKSEGSGFSVGPGISDGTGVCDISGLSVSAAVSDGIDETDGVGNVVSPESFDGLLQADTMAIIITNTTTKIFFHLFMKSPFHISPWVSDTLYHCKSQCLDETY